ncbi:R3H domain-containing nucleic acid-binding protein [Geminocystis sp. NIES-3709]|uniref:Jag family protein n=1 Tax=Geminocystis sp. NIES-3709 TaxID=1617448 RepID=UPI0005FC60A8|nr:R3H domain-containing nucleic acid-binding protein [Geminocystis sp. NIES-3709]BAQ64430.1 RNA-binding protein Jag [Geminocystis sp. NIES-3709]
MDEQIQRGQKWLETLLKLMGVPANVNLNRFEQNGDQIISCWLTIDESTLDLSKIETLTGKKGETIDAIQYLANALLNIGVEDGSHRFFTVELNGYRLRRQAELMAIAQRAAEKVRITGVPEEIRYLSSVERRQIHSILEKSPDLFTESQGNEPDRRLVVKLRE